MDTAQVQASAAAMFVTKTQNTHEMIGALKLATQSTGPVEDEPLRVVRQAASSRVWYVYYCNIL